MRLDKYLKVARIIKRRTIAKDLADDGRVFINDKLAKPSSEVNVDDEITIQFEHRHIKLKVSFLSEKMFRDMPPMYALISEILIPKDDERF